MRRRNLIVGAAALALAAGGTATATAVLGDDGGIVSEDVGKVTARVDGGGEAAAAAKAKKPRVLYLTSEPITIDPATVGPFIDVRISRCPGASRVLDGSVVPSSTDVYQQGAYLDNRREYHVLLGLDDNGAASPVPYQIQSTLICMKGVK